MIFNKLDSLSINISYIITIFIIILTIYVFKIKKNYI